jgi:hypothetical protein
MREPEKQKLQKSALGGFLKISELFFKKLPYKRRDYQIS